jgi:hypothetical protein
MPKKDRSVRHPNVGAAEGCDLLKINQPSSFSS